MTFGDQDLAAQVGVGIFIPWVSIINLYTPECRLSGEYPAGGPAPVRGPPASRVRHFYVNVPKPSGASLTPSTFYDFDRLGPLTILTCGTADVLV